MTQRDNEQIVRIFKKAVKELLKFHCKNNFPFYKEAEAQAWLYMKVYEELDKKGLLFHKCKNCEWVSENNRKGRLIIRLLAKYPKAKNSKNKEKLELSDFAITSLSFCPYKDKATIEDQKWKEASDYEYLIMAEIKSWNNYANGDDIEKLSRSKAQKKYFILLGDEYGKNKIPDIDVLTKLENQKQVYKLNDDPIKGKDKCLYIYYGLIYSKNHGKKKFKDNDYFEWKEKGNLHVYANRGLISD